MTNLKTYSTCTAALLLFGWASNVAACPIPVCQFSLEYWDSDPYEIEVRHKGDLSDTQQAALDLLQNAAKGTGIPANVNLSWRDYSQAQVVPPEDQELPYIRVSYPSMSGIREPLWEGPLDKEVIQNELLHSPMRERIAEYLLNRKTAVWVLLESGDRSKDRQALRTLETELQRLENTLTFPDTGDANWGDLVDQVDFAIISLSRDDPKEQVLANMLLGSERDLRNYENQPIVFPIYGRGLIMYALIGEGINSWTLTDAGEFLTGPTSGEVKNQNPGVDMLMTVAWADKVEVLSVNDAGGVHTGSFLDRMNEAEERLRD